MGDKILVQNPQNISRNKTKGRSCISSEEPFQRLVPGRVCGMSAKPSTVSGMEARELLGGLRKGGEAVFEL